LRRPTVDGQFYSKDFEELGNQINDCFTSKFGPGDLPVSKRNKKIFGIVAPHAGYNFSGPCQAWAYKEVAESKFPETYVILGNSHNGESGVLLDDYQTPFGIVKTDRYFCEMLIKNLDFIKDNKFAHKNEHSVEVQLPFLQYVSKDRLKDIKIVPLVLGYDIDKIRQLGIFLGDCERRINIIISGDFTHYGPSYGYVPFVYNVKKELYDLDKTAISFIEKMDVDGFWDYVNEKGATICAAKSIIATMIAAKGYGVKRARLLQYYTSGDVTGDYNNAVGYGSLVFE